MRLEQIRYNQLNSRQKENYNYQKVSAVLADYGYMTIRLSDDWAGADFIAQHVDGSVLKVQLKGRLTVDKKYEGKDLWICFRSESQWYLYPHDQVLAELLITVIRGTESWEVKGAYSFPYLSQAQKVMLKSYAIG